METSNFPKERSRGMSPIRGYPPMPLQSVPKNRSGVLCHAVIGAAILDAGQLFFEQHAELTDEDMSLAQTAVRSVAQDMLGHYARLEEIRFHNFLGWHARIPAGSRLLSGSTPPELNAQLFEEIASLIQQELGLELQFILSSVYAPEDDVSLALDETTSLSEHALLLGIKSQVVAYRDNNFEQFFPKQEKPTVHKLDLEKLFFNAIVTLDFPKARDLLFQLTDLELKVPETAVSVKPRICNRMAWIIYVLGSPPTNQPMRHNVMAMIAQLDKAASIEALRDGMTEIFSVMEEDYAPSRKHRSKFDRIEAYIRENYRNCNLDAGEICERFEISPPSLSRMFRKNLDTTMLDYIHSLRIQLVKRRLLETDDSIQEISQQCGYYSAWTMARTFKKYEGITPGEYRKPPF